MSRKKSLPTFSLPDPLLACLTLTLILTFSLHDPLLACLTLTLILTFSLPDPLLACLTPTLILTRTLTLTPNQRSLRGGGGRGLRESPGVGCAVLCVVCCVLCVVRRV